MPGLLGSGLLVVALVQALLFQRRAADVRTNWEEHSAIVSQAGVEAFQRAIEREAAALDSLAADAVGSPVETSAAFAALRSSPAMGYGRGVVLFDESGPLAWAGVLQAPGQWRTDSGSLDWSPFYVSLRRTVQRADRRAVAQIILHANPPADRLTKSLEGRVTAAPELDGFYLRPLGETDSPEWRSVSLNGQPLLSIRPRILSQGETLLRMEERARTVGGLWLLGVVFCLGGLAWRQSSSPARRIQVAICTLVLVAIVPFNAYSNLGAAFDPAVYYAPTLGPLSGSLASLASTSALSLLALFVLLRARRSRRILPVALGALIVIGALGPFLLRDLARGISVPARGASLTLWLAWEVTLFLSAACILLAGTLAGRALLGGRGWIPAIGPVLAASATVAAPLLWEAPGRWPDWYIFIWIAAVVGVALTRRAGAVLATTGFVAACGATTLTWYAVSRARVQLAEADVARLSAPDPSARILLQRLADAVQASGAPRNRADLLRLFVQSPLVAAEQPIELSHWAPGDSVPRFDLRLPDYRSRAGSSASVVASARAIGDMAWGEVNSPQGRQLLVAVPHRDGSVTAIALAPRSLLVDEDQFTQLLGLSRPVSSDPPYELVLTTLPSRTPVSDRPAWTRSSNELLGNWLVPGAGEAARAHVRIDLRNLDALLPRGALMVLVDLALFGFIGMLAAASSRGFGRWFRHRSRIWLRSYRSRLTATFLAFFVVPASVFAFWSFDRISENDDESRALLVRETLRSVVSVGGFEDLSYAAQRFGSPLLSYQGGILTGGSDSLFTLLAPVGQFLPPEVAAGLATESEGTVLSHPDLAGVPTLFGYRSVALPVGSRGVLAAPSRIYERTLDRQRRDLGMLVLFATSLGALAALWLSGVAARELGRPVGALRRAALRIARGERYPQHDIQPAAEFVPVFSAFERMDRDLASSRAALEDAHRRTESVLRDVASGVVAIDHEGRIMLSNPGAEKLTGSVLSPGTGADQLPGSELYAWVRQFLQSDRDEDERDLSLGGREVRATLARLTRGGGGCVLTMEDVTELARAQRVLAWGEMARQVAHEIKNPLTPIRLGVQHLRRARRDRRVDFDRIFEQNVGRILAEIDRLDEIARSFSRFGMAPAERPDPIPTDVASVVRDVVDLERLGQGAIDWRTEGTDAPVLALTRDDELREVLLNVLENARQAGASRISVTIRPTANRVEIVIRDDGSGVPAEDLARIFEPRFSTSTSGSGLGLAISRQLVEGWAGRIQAQPADDVGTQIVISLATTPPA